MKKVENKTAKYRLEIILTTFLKTGEIGRTRIVIALDDGGWKLYPSEAKKLAEIALSEMRPRLDRLFEKCFPYQVILHMGKEKYFLIAPSTKKKDDEKWKFDGWKGEI